MSKEKIKNKLIENLTNEIAETTIVKIVKEIDQQMERWNIDERWIDYMSVEEAEEEIYVNVGPRDLDFDKMGNQIGSGYLVIPPKDFPWEVRE